MESRLSRSHPTHSKEFATWNIKSRAGPQILYYLINLSSPLLSLILPPGVLVKFSLGEYWFSHQKIGKNPSSLSLCVEHTQSQSFCFFCLSLLLQRISFLCLASGKMRSCLCSDVLTSCIKFLNFFKTQNILSQIVVFWFISKFHFFIQKGNIWIICQYLRWSLLSPVLCDDTPRSNQYPSPHSP